MTIHKNRGANSKIDENVFERQEQFSKAVAWRRSEKKHGLNISRSYVLAHIFLETERL